MNLQWIASLTVISLLLLTGCKSMDVPPIPNPFSNLTGQSETSAEPPAKMAVIWRESSINVPGRPATRGFGGRAYFYDEENEPMKIDGELVVYAFDESAENARPNVPQRKYVFKNTDLVKRHSETDLGPSYSIWIPWDKVGGPRKTISLLPVFKPTDGVIIKSNQSIAVLPGKDPAQVSNDDSQSTDRPDQNMVRQVSAIIAPDIVDLRDARPTPISQNNGIELDRRRKPTTIRVPRSLGRKMNELTRLERMQDSFQATNAKPIIREPARGNQFANNQSVGDHTRLMPKQNSDTQLTPVNKKADRPVFGRPGAFR